MKPGKLQIFLLIVNFLLLPYLMIKESVLFTSPMRNEQGFDSYTIKPFFYKKKGHNQTNPLLTIATICDMESINSTLQIANNFNGPISIAIYFNSSTNVPSFQELADYFRHINNTYDIYIGIMHPNWDMTDKHIMNKLKHLSIFQVNTEYVLFVDANISYISSTLNSINTYEIKILNMATNNETIWIIPSFQVQNNYELAFKTVLSNQDQNMLIDIPTFSKLIMGNLLICTNYYYITKTIYEQHKSMVTHCSDYSEFKFTVIDNMFIIDNNIKSMHCNQLAVNNTCKTGFKKNHIQKRRRRKKKQTIIQEAVHLKSIDNVLYILIAMAINCEYEIMQIVNSLQYNSHTMNVYWYFNVYNIQKCDTYHNQTYTDITKNNVNIKIEYINPNDIIFSDVQFDYIWFVDDDLLLDLFNFNSFIQLSYSLNSSISQPIIMSKCLHCKGSSWKGLNLDKTNIKNGLVAGTGGIEMMAPMFTFTTYKIIYPFITEIFTVRSTDLTLTDWGADLMWCGAAKTLTDKDCIVIYYTPIIHMDFGNVKKSEQFRKEGMEIIRRVRQMYPEFVHTDISYRKEFYLVTSQTQIPKIERISNQIKQKVLVVGSGLSGAIISTLISLIYKDKYVIDLIDKRSHISGNIYDYIDEKTNIRVPKYGPHYFHTVYDKVYLFINLFSPWIHYESNVVGNVTDIYGLKQNVPIPVNMKTINMLFKTNFTNKNNESIQKYEQFIHNLTSEFDYIKEPINAEQAALKRVGKLLYDNIFKGYTTKQWNTDPTNLDRAITERLPKPRSNFFSAYFNDKYQLLPKFGYTYFIQNMLNMANKLYNNINIKLNENLFQNDYDISEYDKVFYTGPIDQYFYEMYNLSNEKQLEYRSLKFKKIYYNIGNKLSYQNSTQYNQPDIEIPFTRSCEYKLLPFSYENIKGHKLNNWTVIFYEYPSDIGEPYYPINNEKNIKLYKKYQQMAIKEESEKNVYFVGRLANYKYFNMDQAIKNTLQLFEKVFFNNKKDAVKVLYKELNMKPIDSNIQYYEY